MRIISRLRSWYMDCRELVKLFGLVGLLILGAALVRQGKVMGYLLLLIVQLILSYLSLSRKWKNSAQERSSKIKIA